jgi:GNAT superfamily N-acetyltransferase
MESTRVKVDKATQRSAARLDISCLPAPLPPDVAWEAETLFVRIFEYGDYSLRAALCGAYAEHLDCLFALARDGGGLVGAAGALCGRHSPATALLGPVGVLDGRRRRGIGTTLVTSLIEALRHRGCRALYLGVSSGHLAWRLYQRIGFVTYAGIVRRLLLGPPEDWERTYFASCPQVEVRRANWGDYPAVQALLCCPGSMMTVDLCRGIFSSRYAAPARFLPWFPEIMKTCRPETGFVNVLVARQTRSVVGFAYVRRLPGAAQQHIAQLEFYTHDNFLDQASHLVLATLLEAARLGFPWLRCFLLGGDRRKRPVVEGLDGTPIATVPASAVINRKSEDLVVYEWNLTQVPDKAIV